MLGVALVLFTVILFVGTTGWLLTNGFNKGGMTAFSSVIALGVPIMWAGLLYGVGHDVLAALLFLVYYVTVVSIVIHGDLPRWKYWLLKTKFERQRRWKEKLREEALERYPREMVPTLSLLLSSLRFPAKPIIAVHRLFEHPLEWEEVFQKARLAVDNPEQYKQQVDHVHLLARPHLAKGDFKTDYSTVMSAQKYIDEFVLPYSSLFKNEAWSLKRNLDKIATRDNQYPARDMGGENDELMLAFLEGTIFHEFYYCHLPISIPDHLRPEHCVIVARTGQGKSQMLENLIIADLRKADPPSIVLIDSKAGKNDPLERIARLKHKHQDRVIILDPEEEPALNLFDQPVQNITNVAASMRHFMGALLGQELSGQMDVLFLALLHMMLRIPGATLHTFRDVIRDPLQFKEVIAQLPKGPKDFITKDYKDNFYTATKSALITRLSKILLEETFDKMFSAPKNAINIAEELNRGCILLVTPKTSYLHDLSPVFGRYIISRILSAALARAKSGKQKRVHLYIDECGPYVDGKLSELMTTMRSYNIGATLAFQSENQMGQYHATIKGQAAINLVGKEKDENVPPKWTKFTCSLPDKEFPLIAPIGLIDQLPRMTDAEYKEFRKRNRQRVHIPQSLVISEEPLPLVHSVEAEEWKE